MKQDDARELNDKELEEVSGGMVCDNAEVMNEICPNCGKPVLSCICTKFTPGTIHQLRA